MLKQSEDCSAWWNFSPRQKSSGKKKQMKPACGLIKVTGSLVLTASLQTVLGRWHPDRFEQLCLAPSVEPYYFGSMDFATAIPMPLSAYAKLCIQIFHAHKWSGSHWMTTVVMPTSTVATGRAERGKMVAIPTSHQGAKFWPFNVEQFVHVHASFSNFDTACFWKWSVVGPFVMSLQTVYYMQAATFRYSPGGSFSDWLVYPIPCWGLGGQQLQKCYWRNKFTAVASVIRVVSYLLSAGRLLKPSTAGAPCYVVS